MWELFPMLRTQEQLSLNAGKAHKFVCTVIRTVVFYLRWHSFIFEFFWNVLTFNQWNGKNCFRLYAFFFPKTFFRNVLTFSQWNSKNYFRFNVFFFPKTFVQSTLTYRKAFSQSASATENVIDRARNWAKCVRENSKTCLIHWIKSI